VWGRDLRAPAFPHLRMFPWVFFDRGFRISLVWESGLARSLSFSPRVPLGFLIMLESV
jgi:hypothetical protein